MLLHRVPVLPRLDFDLPAPLEGLRTVALNMRWAWNPAAIALFREIDPERFDAGVPPVALLQESQRLNALAGDAGYVARVNEAAQDLERYLGEAPAQNWDGLTFNHPVAYYCAEYGIHESLAQYCGGLGILAGDHCKEASDQSLPFVAIGCLYSLGYFRQSIDFEGRQEHVYPRLDRREHALQRVADPATGGPLLLDLPLPGRTLKVAVWLLAVGRMPLLLLDTDTPENAPEDLAITAQLYMLGRETRFIQEYVLGVGGTKALRALGFDPAAYHMNEGHSALLLVERLREAVAAGKTWKQACDDVRSRSVLTIHTPVPEGNERFDLKLAKQTLEPLLEGSGIKLNELLKLGRDSVADPNVFDMTAFALRLSRAANGVSILHGQTAHNTWHSVTGLPVGAVTNGVHLPTWLGPQVRALYEKVGAEFAPTRIRVTPREAQRAVWSEADQLNGSELWEAHNAQKRALIEFANGRLLRHHTRHGESPRELRDLTRHLDPNALIIGFARRFAPYKRAGLLFANPKRLLALSTPERPIQVLFSGKAHPGDRMGQSLIQDVYAKTQDPRFKGKVFLLEDYDIEIGRALVQGVDLWINNPLRPLEASGTSGMKAAANGVPNASILDGWWDEGYEENPPNGFAVGQRKPQRDRAAQDRFDASSLYRVLEEQVLPLYWDRDAAGLPEGWVRLMKQSIQTSLYAFSTLRMLEDYAGEMYRG